MTKCLASICNSEATRKGGYCNRHYRQIRKHGCVIVSLMDFNEVINKGSYLELVLLNNKSEKVGFAKIDKEDIKKITKYGRWGLNNQGYVFNSKHGIGLHRVIMNAKNGEMVDHKKVGIEGRLDNRKKNLRICNNSQNQHNRGKNKLNTSGFKGVCFDARCNKWRGRIEYKGKKYCCGWYETPEEAHKAYCRKAKQLHKEFYYKEKDPKKVSVDDEDED